MSTELRTARLACGCLVGFRSGVEGSPVTLVLEKRADGCQTSFHVTGGALFDHREALRPSTRLAPPFHPDFEEN